MAKITILVGYHKPAFLFKNEVFLPIHVGRSVATQKSKDGHIAVSEEKWLLENTIGDDSGENISGKNRNYCECTALFWAWKNYQKIGNPDYIGFMHYRRLFALKEDIFSERVLNTSEKAYAIRELDYPSDDLLEKLGLTEENLQNVLNKSGGLMVNPSFLDLVGAKDQREDFQCNISGVKVKDFDLMLDVLDNLYPQLGEYARKRAKTSLKSCFQMWLLPREHFFEYMEFLFTTLQACEKQIDVSGYSVNGQRTIGYLAELLCDYYLNFKKDIWKLKSVNVCFLKNTYHNPNNSISTIKLLFGIVSAKSSYLLTKKLSKKDEYRFFKQELLDRYRRFNQKNRK